VVEDDPQGFLITEINGRPGEAKAASFKFYRSIGQDVTDKLTEKDQKTVRARVLKFLEQLSKEVKAYNSGKDTRTKKNEKLVITKSAPKKATGVKDKIKDILRSDKKRLKYGYTVVPGKVMAGIGSVKSYASSLLKDKYGKLAAKKLTETTKRGKSKIQKEMSLVAQQLRKIGSL
jgi:hypothetical protein